MGVSHYEHVISKYIVFAYKVERNCHFLAPYRSCYAVVQSVVLVYGAILESH
jgi:hypothetical protein